jgi:hypothetical protein
MSLTIYGNGAKSFGQPFMEMVKTLFSDDSAIACVSVSSICPITSAS